MLSERRKTEKEYILYDSNYNSRKCELIYSDRKQISGYLGMGGAGEGIDYKDT